MEIIKKEEIEKLARLARLSMSKEELDSFQGEIDTILAYVKQVQDAVPGLGSEGGQTKDTLSLTKNNMREDEEPYEGSRFTEDILNEAPQKEGGYFKVKKIL